MRAKKYSKELGGTAACSMRIIEEAQYSGQLERQRRESKESGKRELYYGDSWFTSRRLLDALKRRLGHEFFGAMKTNHSKIMKDWPSGSYIVLECKELEMVFVGYKYNYRKRGTYTKQTCIN